MSKSFCKICGKPRQSNQSGSLTQFISLCGCQSLSPDSLELDQEESIRLCTVCGKKVGERRPGSFTQFIFQSHNCSCDRPIPEGDRQTPSPVVSSQGPSFELCENEDVEIEVDINCFPTDRYKPLKVLGKGAAAEVYLARDRVLKKLVTVKILHVHNRESLIAFQDEARAISRLDDPNIIEILDFGVTGSPPEQDAAVPYMVLENFESITLAELLTTQGHCSILECWIIFSQICGGLACAHEQGIFHRDIKPSNILIAGAGTDDVRVKVIDFGVVKFSESSESPDSLRDNGVVREDQGKTLAGTPVYMSPDQLNGYPYDERSEIYSVGCVLFEALVGFPPFQAETALETLSMHVHRPVPKLNEIQSHTSYPESIQQIIESCLAKDPDSRLQSMNDLIRAFEICFEENCELIESRKEDAYPKRVDLPRKGSVYIALVSALVVIPLLSFALINLLSLPQQEESLEKTQKSVQKRPSVSASPATDGEDLLSPRLLPLGKNNQMQRYFAAGDWSDEDLKLVRSMRRIKGLNLSGKQICGSGLTYLKDLELTGIDLSKTPVQDRYLVNLSEIKSLRNVNLSQTSIGNSGVEALVSLPSLTYLNLRFTRVDNTVCESLGRCPTLSVLDLRDLKEFDGSKLKMLSSLKSIVWIILNDTAISEEGFKQLGTLRNIKNLTVERCGVSDLALGELKDLELDSLDLTGNPVTYEGLKKLKSMKGLKGLKRLLVADCQALTMDDVNKLGVDLPRCKIISQMDPRLKMLFSM